MLLLLLLLLLLLYSTLLYFIILYSTLLYSTLLYSTILYALARMKTCGRNCDPPQMPSAGSGEHICQQAADDCTRFAR